MADRRPLVEGLKPTTPPLDPGVEQQFVFAGRGRPNVADVTPTPPPARAPLTTRLRADYVAALKRASLERQLSGQTPYTVQEFLEEALGPWLERHGYLP